VLEYYRGILNEPNAPLRPVVVKSLTRWKTINAGALWVEILEQANSSETERSTAENEIMQLLGDRQARINQLDEAVELTIHAVGASDSLKFKRALIDLFRDMPKWTRRKVARGFKPLTSDPHIGDEVSRLVKIDES